ncbi:uroporphyrinogen-III C-methyltransferase [Anaerobacillus sp. MEB173]|uniref:uroporphyrinogen-III C-methyltransferase n=1 Tax=Anaerobacillus sp. MEB173 TaxID=3383345 RepID=UPI003F8DF02A
MGSVGKVFLVGAGPGDVGLITVKGMESIRQAEVILYDRLVNPLLLEHARPDVELIYCGKLPDRHILRQENINDLLVEKAMEGKMVVRLKGGDPSVFGRVGEEAETLTKNKIPFEIVPGITSGIAASTYAGIPVTHRDYGSSFAMVTGHDKSKDGKPAIDWEALARGIDTIAFYMGVGNIAHISEKLIQNGRSPLTPVILIQWGTTSRQKTLEGNLGNIAALVEETKFSNPAITLVGDIVKLREKVKWFEHQPLFGQQIVVARTGEDKGRLAETLSEQGADVFEYPRIQCQSLVKDIAFLNIIKQIESYDRIAFLSPESVRFFFEGVQHYGVDIRSISAELFGGSIKSKKAIESRGFLAKTINVMPETGKLLIVSEHLLTDRKEKLAAKWTSFDLLEAYEKVEVEQSHVTMRRVLAEGKLDKVIFPSAASVKQFITSIVNAGIDPLQLLTETDVVCMGEQSAKAAKEAGIQVVDIPHEPTVEELITTLTSKKSAVAKA